MNNENSKYTELIDRIKTTQVKFSHPQKLSSKIMLDVEFLSKKKTDSKILRVVSLISSIAAVLLIGLFVFEQFLSSANMEKHKRSNIAAVYVLYAVNKNTHIEKSTALNEFNKLIQMKKERQKKRQTFYSIINKYQNL